mmetsp:Transcript_7062/g.10470  ORF Transcript_7062/g.10470 Transcript_7062/m.10470 type:complete len:258 (-) Transcript_7062:320-1093(-)
MCKTLFPHQVWPTFMTEVHIGGILLSSEAHTFPVLPSFTFLTSNHPVIRFRVSHIARAPRRSICEFVAVRIFSACIIASTPTAIQTSYPVFLLRLVPYIFWFRDLLNLKKRDGLILPSFRVRSTLASRGLASCPFHRGFGAPGIRTRFFSFGRLFLRYFPVLVVAMIPTPLVSSIKRASQAVNVNAISPFHCYFAHFRSGHLPKRSHHVPASYFTLNHGRGVHPSRNCIARQVRGQGPPSPSPSAWLEYFCIRAKLI